MFASIHSGPPLLARLLVVQAFSSLGVFFAAPTAAQTALADQPVLSSSVIPGNLVLPLSVEYPTGVSVAHSGNYATTRRLLGYFDPNKCYSYQYYPVENAATGQLSHFYPNGVATNYSCNTQTGRWSGNFLNWAATQTIDPFRSALTGGNRVVDTATTTILEKAYASGQGGTDNFPNRTTTGATLVSGATPFAWNEFRMRIQGLGVRMRFTNTGNVDADPTAYTGGAVVAGTTYDVAVRVRVCNTAAPGGVETNCRLYGTNYKPEGLIQQYSDRIRYSALGYFNNTQSARDSGVLRARQKFVAPLQPRPGQSAIANGAAEWDPITGILSANPDDADANATNAGFGTSVANSGVINYLNKFGQSGSYKGFDPVSELYYAAVRYLKNLGNVPQWSDMTGLDAATRNAWADGFPVITNWADPILYSCQSNFILGIGDVNVHADKNVPGNTRTEGEPAVPAAVSADTTVNARLQTNAVGTLEGMGNIGDTNGVIGASNGSWLMAGLAYDSHVRDIRPEANMPGIQTIKTFWVDVLEGSQYQKNNQFYLAAKYGGFTVPDGFNPNTVTAATFPGAASWNANGQTLTVDSALGPGISIYERTYGPAPNLRPDTYFTAGTPDSMVAGLTQAFSQIASDLRAATTSFSLSDPQVTATGNASFSASYASGTWNGTVVASEVAFDAGGVPTRSQRWTSDTVLANQFTGAGWNGSRRVVTYSGTAGIPFRSGTGGISTAQLALLDTPYGAGADGAQYLNYLRGERCNEVGATVTTYPSCTTPLSPLGYRARTSLLGDIAGSKVTAVAAPNARYSDAVNPGYAAFVTAESARPRMVYLGANDGMVHALNGELTGAAAGQEVFAYVPSVLFSGPSTPVTPAVDGLVSRGNPFFDHRALVDSTPEVFDIDFARSNGAAVTGNPTPNWQSVLIGGLGKGGKRFYAINVTSPQSVAGEAGWAGRVLWEFPRAGIANQVAALGQMGFTYGRPLVMKMAKYGWVVVFPSGYNSTTGGTTRSYLFIVNPRTGDLLETITVGDVAQASNGLAHVQAYRRDFADNTAESLYAGDLLGNIWRVDVRGTGNFAAVNIARLTTPNGTARQSVTTRLLVEVDPQSGRRYVLVGTGSLLDNTEVASTTPQTFYAIIDGTRTAFSTAGTLPPGFTFPITRAALVANGDASLIGSGVTSTTLAPLGWYVDLGTGAASRAWRVILDPATNAGRVLFSSLLPDAGACASDNASRVYEVAFGTGQSVQLNDANTVIAYSNVPGIVIDTRYLCVGSNCKAYTGVRNSDGTNTFGGTQSRPITLPGLQRLNWRELQIVQ